MSLVGFAKSNKGLEFGWAQPDDQDQFYQRLSRNIRLIDAQLHNQWAHDPDTSFELSFAFFGGVISGESAWLIIPDGKVALTDDATNFVERDGDGNVVVNTNEFTHPDLIPMAQVVTQGGRVITLIDRRPELGGSSVGGGGQITFPQILGVILQGQVPLAVVKQWEGSLAIDFTQLTGIATKAQLPASIAYEDEANVFSQSQTLQDKLIMTAALSQIIPGATSWAVRNNADSVDNIIVTDVGDMAVRADLSAVDLTVTGEIILGGTLSLYKGAPTFGHRFNDYAGTINIGVFHNSGGVSLGSSHTADPGDNTVAMGALVVSDNLTVDTDTLFVNASNNRVGVGTISPSAPLEVIGNTFFTDTQTVYIQPGNRQIGIWTGNNDTETFRVNFRGYLGGTTRFRDFAVDDGKGVNLLFIDGSTGNITVVNDISAVDGMFSLVTLVETEIITGAVTDGFAAALRLDPGYDAASALIVTRHNYLDVQDVSLGGAGPAALTDAAVLRFDAAAGTHKALTTEAVKINILGGINLMPFYPVGGPLVLPVPFNVDQIDPDTAGDGVSVDGVLLKGGVLPHDDRMMRFVGSLL